MLVVTQMGPVENPIDAGSFVSSDDWEAGQPVTYDGAEHTVAVKSESDAVTFLFGFETPDGYYGVTVAVAGTADPCPETHTSVGRRVLDSVSPRE